MLDYSTTKPSGDEWEASELNAAKAKRRMAQASSGRPIVELSGTKIVISTPKKSPFVLGSIGTHLRRRLPAKILGVDR